MFGEHDPLAVAVNGIRAHYEAYGWGSLEKWLLHQFSHYCGGNTGGDFYGYEWFDYSPRGLKLTKLRTGETVEIPKKKILKALGIKDDHRDVLRDQVI